MPGQPEDDDDEFAFDEEELDMAMTRLNHEDVSDLEDIALVAEQATADRDDSEGRRLHQAATRMRQWATSVLKDLGCAHIRHPPSGM